MLENDDEYDNNDDGGGSGDDDDNNNNNSPDNCQTISKKTTKTKEMLEERLIIRL
jgi:hypothetical protein